MGSPSPVTVSVAPLTDDEGKIVGGIEVFRDESERIGDLKFAQSIQMNVLPKRLPHDGAVKFDARYYPHDLVGGDFYDVREIAPHRYGILIADVRGHGVSAALYTLLLKSLEENLSRHARHPQDFLTALNRELMKYVVVETFATAFYAVLDTESGIVRYSSAAHCRPLHYHALSAEIRTGMRISM